MNRKQTVNSDKKMLQNQGNKKRSCCDILTINDSRITIAPNSLNQISR